MYLLRELYLSGKRCQLNRSMQHHLGCWSTNASLKRSEKSGCNQSRLARVVFRLNQRSRTPLSC